MKSIIILVDLYDISLEIFHGPKENTFGSGFLVTFYIKVVILRIILHIDSALKKIKGVFTESCCIL